MTPAAASRPEAGGRGGGKEGVARRPDGALRARHAGQGRTGRVGAPRAGGAQDRRGLAAFRRFGPGIGAPA